MSHKRSKSESYISTPSSHHNILPQSYLRTKSNVRSPSISFSRDTFYAQNYNSCFNLSPWKWTGFKLRGLSSFMTTSHEDLSVHVPIQIRKKKVGVQRKREELEKEVSKLQEMLQKEEKVHEVLDHVNKRNDGSVLSIPSFLPPKTKELIAELAMVESEISRLEGQITEIQTELKREEEITNESKARQWQSEMHEKIKYDNTKALHFISKAIKGEYNNLNDFTMKENMEKFRAFGDHKENNLDEEFGFFERKPRKSGGLKQASPLRDTRSQTTPKRERERKSVSFDIPPKSPPKPAHSDDTGGQVSQPNKLSESIMKCLIFIYVRLLRTSRAMELEKLGTISRSTITHASLSSRSFRVETCLNSKASHVLVQRDSRQQDPYGIFKSEESILRDIGPYKNLVKFTSNSLDPTCLSSSSFSPLLQNLRSLMNKLQKVDLSQLTHQQKLAFWINMYNACIMHGFLQYGMPSNSEKLLMLMNKATLNIGGNIINAQAIEHFILRKPESSFIKEGEKNDKEAIVRKLYGLELMDPNIAFALCCGTLSSPAVKIYTAENIVAELEKSKLEFLQASIVVTSTKKVAFPELLLRNMHDFAEDADSLIKWVVHQLPTAGSLRKSMVECFKRHGNNVKLSTIVEKIYYDFEFQYLLAV